MYQDFGYALIVVRQLGLDFLPCQICLCIIKMIESCLSCLSPGFTLVNIWSDLQLRQAHVEYGEGLDRDVRLNSSIAEVKSRRVSAVRTRS
jgi:hypothetical protein